MSISVVWFRRDLRLIDNEAVARAAGEKCLFVFILDPWFFKQPEIGLLRVKFLFDSLAALDTELRKHGNRLIVLKGESVTTMTALLKKLSANGHTPALYINRDIQVDYGRLRDEAITLFCTEQAIQCTWTDNFFLLHDESQMSNWWHRYYEYQYDEPFDVPSILAFDKSVKRIVSTLPQLNPQQLATDLDLSLPEPRQQLFIAGEPAARQAVYSFLKDRVDGYRWKISRPYLAQQGATSLLGPHLAFGTISNRTVFQTAVNYRYKLEKRLPKKAFDIATYLDRLRWRDSFTQRLWFHPELSWQNQYPEFDEIYRNDELHGKQLEYFERWKDGTTGFPLLDAAMRQLRSDGFINFRMRAMAATFLTINCQVSWHHGARHFMNCLVDGDIAINHWQWQMQAGITNPLSPAFRMYDPTKNFRDRDSSAAYVHFWLPETRGKSMQQILRGATPMLDFNETRQRNGKIVADLRTRVRERITTEQGEELKQAQIKRKMTIDYTKFTAEHYRQYR